MSKTHHRRRIQYFNIFDWFLVNGYPEKRITGEQKNENGKQLNQFGTFDFFSGDSDLAQESKKNFLRLDKKNSNVCDVKHTCQK